MFTVGQVARPTVVVHNKSHVSNRNVNNFKAIHSSRSVPISNRNVAVFAHASSNAVNRRSHIIASASNSSHSSSSPLPDKHNQFDATANFGKGVVGPY